MRLAYADPPYLGSAARHYGHEHERAADYDALAAHAELIQRLQTFDGWALSMASVNLQELLPLCPAGVRVAAWVKPFAIFKPGINPAYAWEPLVFVPARRLPRSEPTERDWLSANVTLRKGTHGAKPPGFGRWVLRLLGAVPEDELIDLFPGSGAVTEDWATWSQPALSTAKAWKG